MSKKIIYLLSLLMALSLVFASCKKNGITGVQGGFNNEENVDITVGGDGLYKEWDKIKDLTVIKNKAIMGVSGEDYYRNPVVVSMGGGKVAVFAEKRIASPGSDNDIGVDGNTPTQIVYMFSSNGGDEFPGGEKVVGEPASITDPKTQSRSAAVVFKVGDDKVVIVASSGLGISRGNKLYDQRKADFSGQGSKVDYIIGKLNTSGNGFDWGEWTEIEGIDTKLQSVTISGGDLNGTAYNQYGTHSARGYIDSSDKLVLPVIFAYQGINGQPGKDKANEMMGAIFYSVASSKVTGTDATLNWDTETSPVVAKFADGGNTFSIFKELSVVGGTAAAPDYLVVPSPGAGKKTVMGQGTGSGQVTDTDIQGAEGSPAFLDIRNNGWFGAQAYDPAKYKDDPSTAGREYSTSGKNQKLFMHVTVIYNTDSKLRLLNDNNYSTYGTPMDITAQSKSASLDVLPDGTIITAAEKEQYSGVKGLKFKIYFSRYTQKHIADKTAGAVN